MAKHTPATKTHCKLHRGWAAAALLHSVLGMIGFWFNFRTYNESKGRKTEKAKIPATVKKHCLGFR